jgi:glutamine synthetase
MICLEYIWLDYNKDYRSKIKIVEEVPNSIEEIPRWNYDGSSTGQATVEDSEITLVPVKMYRNEQIIYVLCETLNNTYIRYATDYLPDNGSYFSANFVFDKYKEHQPMFGIEQEFFMFDMNGQIPEQKFQIPSGKYYCGNGPMCSRTRPFLEEVMQIGIKIGIRLTGMNYEVAPGQAEFQVCNIGIDACTDLLLLRFLLVRIGEKYNITIDFSPKPIKSENGSGCHINFSTKELRECLDESKRIDIIMNMCGRLELCHDEFINKYYGEGNKERLSGKCETSDYKEFSVSGSSRSVSIRPESGHHYFEDRRPASNINPYLACSKLFYHIIKK